MELMVAMQPKLMLAAETVESNDDDRRCKRKQYLCLGMHRFDKQKVSTLFVYAIYRNRMYAIRRSKCNEKLVSVPHATQSA